MPSTILGQHLGTSGQHCQTAHDANGSHPQCLACNPRCYCVSLTALIADDRQQILPLFEQQAQSASWQETLCSVCSGQLWAQALQSKAPDLLQALITARYTAAVSRIAVARSQIKQQQDALLLQSTKASNENLHNRLTKVDKRRHALKHLHRQATCQVQQLQQQNASLATALDTAKQKVTQHETEASIYRSLFNEQSTQRRPRALPKAGVQAVTVLAPSIETAPAQSTHSSKDPTSADVCAAPAQAVLALYACNEIPTPPTQEDILMSDSAVVNYLQSVGLGNFAAADDVYSLFKSVKTNNKNRWARLLDQVYAQWRAEHPTWGVLHYGRVLSHANGTLSYVFWHRCCGRNVEGKAKCVNRGCCTCDRATAEDAWNNRQTKSKKLQSAAHGPQQSCCTISCDGSEIPKHNMPTDVSVQALQTTAYVAVTSSAHAETSEDNAVAEIQNERSGIGVRTDEAVTLMSCTTSSEATADNAVSDKAGDIHQVDANLEVVSHSAASAVTDNVLQAVDQDSVTSTVTAAFVPLQAPPIGLHIQPLSPTLVSEAHVRPELIQLNQPTSNIVSIADHAAGTSNKLKRTFSHLQHHQSAKTTAFERQQVVKINMMLDRRAQHSKPKSNKQKTNSRHGSASSDSSSNEASPLRQRPNGWNTYARSKLPRFINVHADAQRLFDAVKGIP